MKATRDARRGFCLALAVATVLLLNRLLSDNVPHAAAAAAACGHNRAFSSLGDLQGEKNELDEDAKAKIEAARKQQEQAEQEHQAALQRKQKEEQEEAKRIQAEIDEEERLRMRIEDGLEKAQKQAKRPLSRFEQRKVRRRVLSEFANPATRQRHLDDWSTPLKREVRKQLEDAVKYFSESMRVPATLLANAALGALFLPPWAMDAEGEKQQPSWAFELLRQLYLLLTAVTFCAELTTVLTTSNAHARLLELGRDGLNLEPTAMELIMTHVEFEYLTCSLNFYGGLMAFMLAMVCRTLAVFSYAGNLEAPRDHRLSAAISCMMVACLLWWVHMINARTSEFHNMGQMVGRYLQLVLARVRVGDVGIMGIASLLLMFWSGVQAILAVCGRTPRNSNASPTVGGGTPRNVSPSRTASGSADLGSV